MSSPIKAISAANCNRVLYLTPRVLTAVICHALSGVDTFIIGNCTQRAEYNEDLYNIHAQYTHNDVRFTASYIGRTRWEINILT